MGFSEDVKRIASQLLGNKVPDNTGVRYEKRIGSYFEDYVQSVIPDFGVLALEGTIWTVNNAQTGIATAAAPTAFSHTNPFILIYNTENPANPLAKDIIVDYIMLMNTAAGTGGASLQYGITLDSGNRYVSGGTDLSSLIVNPNGRASKASIAKVWSGNITASTQTSVVRSIVGNRVMKGAIPAAGDMYTVKFGAVDQSNFIGLQNAITIYNGSVPKVVIPPNWSLLLNMFVPSQSVASSYNPEITWIER